MSVLRRSASESRVGPPSVAIRVARALCRLLGLALIVLPFVPIAGWLEHATGRPVALVPPSEWLLGLLIFGVAAWLVALALANWNGADAWASRLEGVGAGSEKRFVALLLFILAGILLLVSTGVFSGRPLLIDSIAQVFQARVFSAGEVKILPPGPAEFFLVQQVVPGAEGWYAQYPPGHALMLALGEIVRAGWMVPILLSIGSALAIFLFARAAFGRDTARLTLILLLVSPFFWFMGASYMNHVSSLFFVAVASWLLAAGEQRQLEADRHGAGMLLGGSAALGAAFLVRPLTAVAVLAVLLPAVALSLLRRRRAGLVASMLATTVGIGSLLLLYNHVTTGAPLRLGYTELWGAGHGLGFHESPWGATHTPLRGLAQELADVSLLNQALFEWPIPALLPVGILLVLGAGGGAWVRRCALAFLALPLVYLFYWHRDTYLGPRFLYASLVFIVPLTAKAILECWRWAGGRAIGPARSALRAPARPLMGALLVLCIGYMTVYAAPRRFADRAAANQSLKVDLADEAARAGIEQGIVFVAVSWGNRIISRLRALGVSASLTERAYQSVDHCRLHEVVEGADASALEGEGLQDVLAREIRESGRVVRSSLNGDPTLRLDPQRPLSPGCRAEIAYDRRGYTVYAPHLTANRPAFDGPLLFVRDLGPANAALRARYPERPSYLYRPGGFSLLPGAPSQHREAVAREPEGGAG